MPSSVKSVFTGKNGADPRIIVALDYAEQQPALDLAARLSPALCRLKVGKELFTAVGPLIVEKLNAMGFEVFLDLKFHDIPNTVAKAIEAAANLGVWMVNVHACGGRGMLEAAAEAVSKNQHKPLLIGVTVLTSSGEKELHDIGVECSPQQQVLRLAKLVKQSGLDGVVCSAQEADMLSSAIDSPFCLVTPGIRPMGSLSDDQRRIVTPADAISFGSDYLVVGRPITQSLDPLASLQAINQEVADVLMGKVLK